MNLVETRLLSTAAKEQVRLLWNREYPLALEHKNLSDLDNYLNALQNPRHYLLENDPHGLAGWAFAFERDGSTWFAIIISSPYKRSGHGSRLLRVLKENNKILNGWVIDHHNDRKADGSVYESPLNFYLNSGFVLIPGVRLQTEKISAVKIYWKI